MKTLGTTLKSIQNVKVIDDSIDYRNYIPIDLSVSNDFFSEQEISTSIDFEEFIEKYLAKENSKVAYGGYNEVRNLYKRSTVFNLK